MERRFECTACGKCCHGILPLSIHDALANAGRFPLFVVWTPVRQGGKSYEATASLGVTIKLKKRKQAAIRISPAAYLPAEMPCPALDADGLCAIQENKPLRCLAMPFAAERDEADQQDLLTPKPGWKCDTSDAAPVVYRDKAITTREHFDRERRELLRDAAVLKPYAEWLLDAAPDLKAELTRVAMRPTGGRVVTGFSTLIPRLPQVDIYDFAARQLPVMRDFAEKVSGDGSLAEFHRQYETCVREWQGVAAAKG